MGWVSRDGVADCCAIGVVCGRADRDPIGAAGHAPYTAGQGANADGVVGENVAVVYVGEAESEGARSGVLSDGSRLAVNCKRARAGQMA